MGKENPTGVSKGIILDGRHEPTHPLARIHLKRIPTAEQLASVLEHGSDRAFFVAAVETMDYEGMALAHPNALRGRACDPEVDPRDTVAFKGYSQMLAGGE